jgi:hypothetical protein
MLLVWVQRTIGSNSKVITAVVTGSYTTKSELHRCNIVLQCRSLDHNVAYVACYLASVANPDEPSLSPPTIAVAIWKSDVGH